MPFGWEILVSLIAGFIGGYSGIAGAPFIIFIFSNLLGYSQHVAQGTVLAMMLGPMTILPVYYGREIVRRRLKEIVIAIVSYMIFSFAGAQVAYLFTSSTLQVVFGSFVATLGIMYLIFAYMNKTDVRRSTVRISPIIMVLIGMILGTIGGMVGIGAGILLIPILTIGFSVDHREAQVMSLAILLPPVSLGAVLKYGIAENDIVWPLAALMLVGYVITSGLGYKLSLKHAVKVVRTVLALLLIATGVISIIGNI